MSCAFEVPLAPAGGMFDGDEVNVVFEDGEAGTFEFGRTESSTQCEGVADGWFYDDSEDPTEILLCPQTCARVQGLAQASIAVIFGCATVPAA